MGAGASLFFEESSVLILTNILYSLQTRIHDYSGQIPVAEVVFFVYKITTCL